MPKGYLRIQTKSAQGAIPIKEVMIRIYQNHGNDIINESFHTSDALGLTPTIPLEAPEESLSFSHDNHTYPYAKYCVEAKCEGYENIEVVDVQVFANCNSTLPLALIPSCTKHTNRIVSFIGAHALFKGARKRSPLPVLSHTTHCVNIPTTLCVHLGRSKRPAENIYISFIDYLKNTASSELYPTWEKEALKAFIHTQISFVLHRIQTKHYPNKGRDFDITSDVSEDLLFIKNRNIFDSVSEIVDEVFNEYLQVEDFALIKEGFPSSFTKWKMQELAKKGLCALAILKECYGENVFITTSNHLPSISHTYPGTPLRTTSKGSDVKIIQTSLNEIAVLHHVLFTPLIVDGIFDDATKNAIQLFQKLFCLREDGIVGKRTWYKIAYLTSTTDKIQYTKSHLLLPSFPTTLTKKDMEIIQSALNTIGTIYSNLPVLLVDGEDNEDTKKAIAMFQSIVELPLTNEMNESTWKALFTLAEQIRKGMDPSLGLPVYPTSFKEKDIQWIQNCLQVLSLHYPSIGKIEKSSSLKEDTRKAIINFQSLLGLKQDGQIKEQTWYKINEVYYELQE